MCEHHGLVNVGGAETARPSYRERERGPAVLSRPTRSLDVPLAAPAVPAVPARAPAITPPPAPKLNVQPTIVHPVAPVESIGNETERAIRAALDRFKTEETRYANPSQAERAQRQTWRAETLKALGADAGVRLPESNLDILRAMDKYIGTVRAALGRIIPLSTLDDLLPDFMKQ